MIKRAIIRKPASQKEVEAVGEVEIIIKPMVETLIIKALVSL